MKRISTLAILLTLAAFAQNTFAAVAPSETVNARNAFLYENNFETDSVSPNRPPPKTRPPKTTPPKKRSKKK